MESPWNVIAGKLTSSANTNKLHLLKWISHLRDGSLRNARFLTLSPSCRWLKLTSSRTSNSIKTAFGLNFKNNRFDAISMAKCDSSGDMHDTKPLPIALLLLGIGGTGKSSIAPHLARFLEERGHKLLLIRFDEFRKGLVPPGIDPFSKDPSVKAEIYRRAAAEFLKFLQQGISLVIDSGLSIERIRRDLKEMVPRLKICHIHCPLVIAIMRDTKRSFSAQQHERGRWLHLRALRDFVNPLKKDKFPQPGVTSPFQFPECADLHVNTFLRTPESAANEIIERLQL